MRHDFGRTELTHLHDINVFHILCVKMA